MHRIHYMIYRTDVNDMEGGRPGLYGGSADNDRIDDEEE